MTPMKPSDRAALIARAKRAAVPVANCVAARIAPGHLTERMSRAEVEALVIVLAEAADHALLREVCAAVDDGRPDAEADAEARYRKAHAEAERLRAAKLPVPNGIRCLDSAYHQSRKAARLAVPPDPDAERNRMALAEALRERRAS